ncbi:MAG: hypothetical protein ACR2KP_02455 [Egibacteraceae bacterium]
MLREAERSVVIGVAAVIVAVAAGLLLYVVSAAHGSHGPFHALQQLDLLYLDEAVPALDRLELPPNERAVIVVCLDCQAPSLRAEVVLTDDEDVARALGLQRASGEIGPGYALVDERGRVRYRTFDPGLSDHEAEIRVLLEAL